MNYRLVILILLLFTSIHARAFGTETHGGDQIAQDFVFAGQTLKRALPYVQSAILNREQLSNLSTAFDETTVLSASKLILMGQEVDAINQPAQHKITVNRSRWNFDGPEVKSQHLALALHEYLWISGVNDANYSISKIVYPEFESAIHRWNGTPIAQGLRNALCIGIITRDHVSIDQALGLGADLDGDCGKVEYRCPQKTTGEIFWDSNNYGPVGLALRELGPENLCSFSVTTDPDQDSEQLAILEKLVKYHPDLRRTVYSFGDYNGLAISKHSWKALDILVKAGSNPRTAMLRSEIWPRETPMIAPEYLLEDIVSVGFDFNDVYDPDYDPKLLTSTILVESPGTRLEFFDFLVTNHKIDFCKISTNARYRPQVFSKPVGQFVRDEYLAIARKYRDPCVR